MSQELLSAMRQSIMDGAPATSAELARQALGDGIMPLEAINSGYVPGMHAVGEQFAKGQMFLPDMLASAEAMRAAMAVLDPELKKLGSERPVAGAEPRCAGDARLQVVDRTAHRVDERFAACEPRRHGGGKRAAGAVRGPRLLAGMREALDRAVV